MDILQIISDILSVITISLCFILKFPQIKKIYDKKDAKGINVMSSYMNIFSYSVTACYNVVNGHNLLSYMEYPVIIVQELTILLLILKYNKQLNRTFAAAFLAYSLFISCFCLGYFSPHILTVILPFCMPISLSSKFLQLCEIHSKKNADSVSIETWAISSFTNATRIFTIFMDSADILLLINVSSCTFLSASIMATVYYYQNQRKTK